MKRNLVIALFASLLSMFALPMVSAGGDEPAPRFGPYEAITFNKTILNDVKYETDGNVYLQLLPDHKDKELVVKISNEYYADYRQWWHGGYELVSPANQGKPPYAWTDYVNTGGRYIEYWMDGSVFLHLKRVD